MKYEEGAVVIWFSQPGAVFFPEEKVMNEVALMCFLTDQTSIPIPFILHSGTKKESPLELGPFIMMDYIEHETKMYDTLNTPGRPSDEQGILDPNINKDRLEFLYGELADILIWLSTPSLPQIGSLSQINDFTWEVTRRPLSMNMNDLLQLGGLLQSILPDTTFDTTSSYFKALVNLIIQHLVHQRNDAMDSTDDCQQKFVAQQLFLKLAREKQLNNPSFEEGPFKIWCDDFRPANVLLKENLQIASVVDWEFTYAAPVDFSHALPWWLLIKKPELWPKGIDNWARVFDHHLKTFLKAMKGCEDKFIQQDQLEEHQQLSGPMQQSWESGDFWIMYAMLHSFAFDAIYWQKIDPRFFGPTESPEEAWKERLNLLNKREKDEMEQLVVQKVEEMQTRALEWDPDEYTMAYRQQLKRQKQKEKEEKANADADGDEINAYADGTETS